MNIRDFLVSFAYEFVTWVCIAACFGGIWHCLNKGNRKGAVRWGIGLFLSIIAMIVLQVYRHMHEPAALQAEQPYVTVNNVEMDSLKAGSSPTVRFGLDNGRQTSIVNLRRISWRLTPFVPEKYLTYLPGAKTERFELTPHQKMIERWTFLGLVLTQGQIDDLNAKPPNAELYFFADGDYSNESGTHSMPTCFRYDPDFPNHIALCADGIKIE